MLKYPEVSRFLYESIPKYPKVSRVSRNILKYPGIYMKYPIIPEFPGLENPTIKSQTNHFVNKIFRRI